MIELSDRVVLVAGATGALGGAVVRSFHAASQITGAALPIYGRS
jgi:NAD(P)-dependent dehydrogenase (short-subunit alcohol dehydrogenase family)